MGRCGALSGGRAGGSLALLVQRVSAAHVEDLVDSLCTKLLSGKREQERDVAAIGLKTVVTDLPSGAVATLVVRRLCPKLVAGIQRKARRAAPPVPQATPSPLQAP